MATIVHILCMDRKREGGRKGGKLFLSEVHHEAPRAFLQLLSVCRLGLHAELCSPTVGLSCFHSRSLNTAAPNPGAAARDHDKPQLSVSCVSSPG